MKLIGRWGTRTQLDQVRIDPSTASLNVVDYAHHEAHDGEAYFAVYSAEKDDAGVIEVRIQTPDSPKFAHMVFGIESALAATAEMWVPTTKTDDAGNRITPFQRNGNSANASGLTICHTPGGAQAGTAQLIQYIGAASTNGRVNTGGGTGSRGEFILRRNTAYLVKLTSRADSNALSIILDWYEHTSKH